MASRKWFIFVPLVALAVVWHPVKDRGLARQAEARPPARTINWSSWPTFQGGWSRTGYLRIKPIASPKILWRAEIGIQSWLNSPIIVNDLVIVGSSGRRWNEPDGADGVYALDLATGERSWFTPANNDVNGVSFADGLVVATGDEGAIWAMDVDTGRIRWRRKTHGGKMYTNPLLVADMAIAGDASGNIFAYDLQTGGARWSSRLRGAIRGGAAANEALLYVASTGGEVVALTRGGQERWRQALTRPSYDRARDVPAEIYAAPTLVQDLVVITYARDTYYHEPAIIALDHDSGAVRWRAAAPPNAEESWGNVRSSPALYQNTLIYGEPYSNRLVAVNARAGQFKWASHAGFCMFPQWPSPAVTGGTVLLPRHDGGLYAFNADTGKPLWKLYLGDSALAGEEFPAGVMPPDSVACAWSPQVGAPIFASPAVAANGVVVVGTGQGILYAIGDGGAGKSD